MTVHLQVRRLMPARSERVFDTLHDYDRRLDWDTLLQRATVHGDDPPGRGVVTTCTARRSLGGLAFTTEYKAFRRPRVAAVKLLRPTGPFAAWGASIVHEDVDDPAGPARSWCTYTMTFVCRPRVLAPLLEAVAQRAFRWETDRRLKALAAHLVSRPRADHGREDGKGSR